MAKRFTPVRGKDADIRRMGYNEGYVYFAIDTGFIYLDMNGEKHTLGGSGTGGGSSFIWANAEEDVDLFKVNIDDDEDMNYTMAVTAIEGSTEEDPHYPQTGLLVINSDGRFFRVMGDNAEQGLVNLYLIAVSGDGTGGGGSVPTVQDIDLTQSGIDMLGSTYIYQKDAKISFTPTTTVDETCSLSITVTNSANEEVFARNFRVRTGTVCEINASDFPVTEGNDFLTLTALVISDHSTYNKGRGLKKTYTPIKVHRMYLTKASETNDGVIGVQTGNAILGYRPFFAGLGTNQEPVKTYYSIDNGDSVFGAALNNGDNQQIKYLTIPHQQHGVHLVKTWLSVIINGVEYTSESITYEVPFVDMSNDDPIIWIKEELGTIIQYEPAVVKYLVYSKNAATYGSNIEVQFLQEGALYDSAEIKYEEKWQLLDLTSRYNIGENHFSIVSGNARKDIEFVISTEGARDLNLKNEEQLELNFSSMGRSNKQIKTNRNKWVSTATPSFVAEPYEAQLNNFNWYNNGWLDDEDGLGSYLSVTNGASVTIPTGIISMNAASSPWTFEMRFRIRNAKKFATLVTEIPLYKYTLNGEENADGDEKTLEEIEAIGGEVMIDKDGNKEMNEKNTTRKIVRSDKYIAFKYLWADPNSNNVRGFAIGTQEAYFSVGSKVVNVKYKENEVISISFVVDKAKNQLSIYLNGILSGVGDLNKIGSFTMENIPFEISSEYCDFDLFNFRAYPLALTMPEIIHNYIADSKSIELYDENLLTDDNYDDRLSYDKLVEYNENHQDKPTMPYVVIDMTTANTINLPYAKTAKGIDNTRIVFVNPTGDILLDNGEITPWEYYTSCPSYEATNVNINVQGTSSQIYPRRNFKTKFKKAKWKFTHGPLEGKNIAADHYFKADGTVDADVEAAVDAINEQISNGEITSDEGKPLIKAAAARAAKTLKKNWHLDHEKIGTNKFTWKIDYMESSGTYNTGFANLMGSGVYSKHPLEDLNLTGVNADDYRTSVYGFPMLAFHKTSENDITYIGRYNCNLDKSANERYGFELEVAQPYITLPDDSHPLIADVAECWELRDNQGTWCSFRYPTQAMREAGFAAATDPINEPDRIEVVQHFEARYNKYGDQFEWGQNVILNKENNDDFSSEVGSPDDLHTISLYLQDKLKNFKVLFDWLDSTDTRSATNETLPQPVTYKVSSALADAAAIAEQGISYESSAAGTFGTFTKDTTEYRRQKFYAEFDKHLDKHYCTIYFIMTELMLCYDSRGKNMMIASFGPTANSDGNYVWYPIFYDIDTQLGLNNVGAKLWDYDEDCTENGTFSTKDSVLWVNFADLFKTTIEATYRELRGGGGDDATLSYKNIEGAYLCDPEVFTNSIAMRGRRPLIAMGLDEYYKYVLPVTVEWINQEGNLTTANYLYACQGDRKLSRELLIENRLLYMDSKWEAGSFGSNTGGKAGIMFRVTGNKPGKTSDKYLESSTLASNQVYGEYPVPYYDAIPEYTITPYLNFYVTYFIDEAGKNKSATAYNEETYPNGITTTVSPGVVEAYRSGAVDQQLNYFAGSSYISSLGDLSTKYANQVRINNAPRLLEINLGSDAPDYFYADTLDPFELCTEVDDITGKVRAGHEKPLLNKINLTHVRSLRTALDVRSPDKLTEFRALDTGLEYALFAKGAPLNTVHLPRTVTELHFIQNKNLNKILDAEPVVFGVTNHATYEGLYIQDTTDYTITDTTTLRDANGSPIAVIDFEGDALGYGSYKILENVVAKKNGTDRSNRLKISMIDVNWSPYTQVEYGENENVNTTYYYLTDHSTYVLYNSTNVPNKSWVDDTLNGRVYTYDSTAPRATIDSLKLLEVFRNDYTNTVSGINQFTNNIETMNNQKTYPTITGTMFIANANGTPISETYLSTLARESWPDLIIRAENIETSYLTKYVEIDPNTNKEIVLDNTKFSDENAIMLTDKKKPTRTHYDFLGFSPTKPGTGTPTIYVQRNQADTGWELTAEGEAATIDPTTKSITLYAIYEPHKYVTAYHFNNGKNGEPEHIEYVETPSNEAHIRTPLVIPSKEYDYGDLENVPGLNVLGLYRTYKFLGWAPMDNPNNPVGTELNYSPTQNREFIAVYEDISVYNNVADEKYFTVTGDGELRINPDYYGVLSGKVTIPATINGTKYIRLGSFGGASNSAITHIFFAKSDNGSTPVLISTSAFGYLSGLVYFEMPQSVSTISSGAFQYCSSLGSTDDANGTLLSQMFATQKTIEANAFSEDSSIRALNFGSAAHTLASQSFGRVFFLKKLIIGSPDEPSLMTLDNLGSSGNHDIFAGRGGNRINNGEGVAEIFLANDSAQQMFEEIGLASGKFVLTAHS